jgi:hypothetical protein
LNCSPGEKDTVDVHRLGRSGAPRGVGDEAFVGIKNAQDALA